MENEDGKTISGKTLKRIQVCMLPGNKNVAAIDHFCTFESPKQAQNFNRAETLNTVIRSARTKKN